SIYFRPFFLSSRRRHTRSKRDWSSDVCSSDLPREPDGITDTQYSIECGILELKHALREVNCSGPEDIQDIEIALQAYNFGTGYQIGRASCRERVKSAVDAGGGTRKEQTGGQRQ